jgi:hypothetical protein
MKTRHHHSRKHGPELLALAQTIEKVEGLADKLPV